MHARTVTRTAGFTLIEMLIVMTIVGILASLLIPNLFGARRVAFDRAALAYAHNIYKAGNAYVAESTANSVAAGTCGTGSTDTSFGGYTVQGPGSFVTGCSYTAGAAKVTVTYTGGNSTVAVVGL